MKIGPLAVPGYYVGDCRYLLRQLPPESINCCVTSLPYWALRDYGIEPSLWGADPYCTHTWGEDGNLHKGGSHGDGVLLEGGRSVVAAQAAVKDINTGAFCSGCGAWRGQLGLEPTPDLFVQHLVEVFREVRRVLRADGTVWVNLGDSYATGAGSVGDHPGGGKQGESWKLRGAMTPPNRLPIPGLKPKDLIGVPWRAAFALQADGWWLRSDIVWHKPNPMPESVTDRPTKSHEYVFLLTKSEKYHYDADAIREPISAKTFTTFGNKHRSGKGNDPGGNVKADNWATTVDERQPRLNADGTIAGANKRSVWTIGTEPTPDAHFATFPRKLVEPCILAGCPAGGVVLDPFGGSGTVGRVAEDHGRNWLLFDLNPQYAAIAKRKTAQTGLLGRTNGQGAA